MFPVLPRLVPREHRDERSSVEGTAGLRGITEKIAQGCEIKEMSHNIHILKGVFQVVWVALILAVPKF